MKILTGKKYSAAASALIILVIFSLACGIRVVDDEAGPTSQQQTIEVLSQTQTALADLSALAPQPTPVSGQPAGQVEPTTPATPTFPPQPDVQYNGISFSYDKTIANSVSQVVVQGQFFGDAAMPGETFPSYYEFTFNTYPVTDNMHDPAIRVYPVAEYEEISQLAADTFEEMRGALRNKATPAHRDYLPFLPFWNAGMVFNAKVDYLNFQNGEGMRYLTMFAQAAYPPDNRNVFYTFQGITGDGKYYISAIFPISNPELPDNGDSVITDYWTFEENWPQYLQETVEMLNKQDPASFKPDLGLIDEIIASLKINP